MIIAAFTVINAFNCWINALYQTDRLKCNNLVPKLQFFGLNCSFNALLNLTKRQNYLVKKDK